MQPHITLNIPPDNKAFWGAILGAIIGTMGAIFVALIAVWADRRKSKSEYQLQQLRKYNHHLVRTETELNEQLPIMLKNIHLLQKCADAKAVGNFMMNLPRTMELTTKNVGDFINRQLVNEWITVSMRTRMCDQLIEDFSKAYKEVRELAFNTSATGQPINVPLIEDHKTQLLEYAESAKKSAENLVSDCIRMLAMLQLHGENIQNEEAKIKDIKKLENFELDKQKLVKKVSELEKRFTVANVLGAQ